MILGLSLPKFIGAIFVGLVLSMVLISILSSITPLPEVKEEPKPSTCYISELSNSPSLMKAQCDLMNTIQTAISMFYLLLVAMMVVGLILLIYEWV